jgi:hypothetical protein
LPLKLQSVTVGLLLSRLLIPPPSPVAVLPLNVQLVTVGLLDQFLIPPPLPPAVLPLNVQLLILDWLPL